MSREKDRGEVGTGSGAGQAQSRQSARVSGRSSELAPPPPPTQESVQCVPPGSRWGGDTFACREGAGGANSFEETDTMILFLMYSIYVRVGCGHMSSRIKALQETGAVGNQCCRKLALQETSTVGNWRCIGNWRCRKLAMQEAGAVYETGAVGNWQCRKLALQETGSVGNQRCSRIQKLQDSGALYKRCRIRICGYSRYRIKAVSEPTNR